MLALDVMLAHNDTALYVNICQLIDLYQGPVEWEEGRGTRLVHVLLLALQNSIAPGAHLESTLMLLELITKFRNNHHPITLAMCANGLANSVLVRVLVRMLVHDDPETPAHKIEKHNITCGTVRLMQSLVQMCFQTIILIPGVVQVLTQTLSALHVLLTTIPIVHPNVIINFPNNEPRITHASVHTAQLAICQCLVSMSITGHIAEDLFRAGALPVLFRLIEQTTCNPVRSAAIQTATCIAIRDNAQTLRILNAGGLEILAVMLKRTRNTHRYTSLYAFSFLNTLSVMPVYATAMQRLGFVQIMQQMCPTIGNIPQFVARLQATVNNPVYP
jgi:hypothetical protein